jgi:hypothetical protein
MCGCLALNTRESEPVHDLKNRCNAVLTSDGASHSPDEPEEGALFEPVAPGIGGGIEGICADAT